ncbi:unnamed protein product [Nesidiocoris tenuis]|uniref:SWIM-type domain-containing protein n=1 Tax=Nesidiocoris tenuis TaxID=355587 RepID=A0A6H5GYK4_9HEMI|nr:unnamed protein product [Nesidiocoris tenuis]
MIEHYTSCHEYKVNRVCYDFQTVDEFNSWKERVEREEMSRYIVLKGTAKLKTVNVTYFRCYRDGLFHSRGTGKRLLKVKGTNKMNGCCPSEIKLVEDRESGHVKMHLIKDHFGHSIELDRLPLLKQEKDLIAEKLAQKVPMNKVLDEIHNSKCDQLERIHLITRKDVFNIATAYKLKNENTRRSIEGVSPDVEAWVKRIEIETNVVRLFKPQGILMDDEPRLTKSDFVLIVFNDMQVEFMKTYGHQVVGLDRIHGRSKSDYELVSVLVIDELLQCLPCAFLLSNRIDDVVIQIFVSTLSRYIGGVLKPDLFTSDVADVFHSCWSSVMGRPTRQFFNPWHVEKDWSKMLVTIKNAEKRANAHKIIKGLMKEKDEEAFCQLLKSVHTELTNDPETRQFGFLFNEKYSNNYSSWAVRLSSDKVVEIVTHLECAHKSIRLLFLQGKKMKRLDQTMAEVMRMIRDTMLDNSIISHRGKGLTRAHESFLLPPEISINIEKVENGWKVHSPAWPLMTYEVTPHMVCQCHLRCAECRICIHSYRCSCAVSTMEWLVCQHVHALANNLTRNVDVGAQTTPMLGSPEPVEDQKIMVPVNGGKVNNQQRSHGRITIVAPPVVVLSSEPHPVHVNGQVLQSHHQPFPSIQIESETYQPIHQQLQQSPQQTSVYQDRAHHGINNGEETRSVQVLQPSCETNVPLEFEELLFKQLVKPEDSSLDMRQAKNEALKLVQDIFDAIETREQLAVFTNSIIPVLPIVTAMKFSNTEPC